MSEWHRPWRSIPSPPSSVETRKRPRPSLKASAAAATLLRVADDPKHLGAEGGQGHDDQRAEVPQVPAAGGGEARARTRQGEARRPSSPGSSPFGSDDPQEQEQGKRPIQGRHG